jgi:hypothetical protein
MTKPKSVAPRSPSSKRYVTQSRKPSPTTRNHAKRNMKSPPKNGVSTPGLVGIGVMIGLTGHIVEQSRGEAWWSTQNAYAADAALARQAILGVSPQTPRIEPAVIAPADPDLDPRPPVVAALTQDGPEQPSVGFLDGLELPTGLVIPEEPAIERYIQQYGVSPQGKAMFRSWWRRSGEYDRLVESALRKHRIPIALKALVFVESAFQLEAVSPAGASGLWQFMKGTAEAYDLVVEPHYDQRFDPHAASNAAAKHLSDLYAELDDWPLALAAYNYGLANVRARLEEAGVRTFWELAARDDLLPQETRQYVPRILALSVILSNQEHFGLDKVRRVEAGPRTTRYEPPLGVSLSLIARAAGTSTNQLLKLNPQLRKGELPGAGDPVTLNVRGTWYARIEATLPLLLADGVRRRDLEVDADFDWGKDEWVDGVTPNDAAPGAVSNSGVTIDVRSPQPQPAGIARPLPAAEAVTPSPILGVGTTAPREAPQTGLASVEAGMTTPGAPLKASPILSVTDQAAKRSLPLVADELPERRLLPIRLTGQANRLNAASSAQSFTPLGVTVSPAR